MSRRTPLHFAAAFSVAAAAVALAVVVVGAKPAQALPSYESTCSNCHAATPSGTVTATPSKTSLAPGEAYTVDVSVNLSSGGRSGWWISNNDAATPVVNLSGGPGTSPFTADMTAPGAAGTYTYKVWGAKGTPGSGGQSLMTTYQITVASAPAPAPTPTADTTAPTTKATGAADNGWYKTGVTVDLTATDNPGGDGVAFITYALDGGAPVQVAGSSAQVQISGDGAHTLTYEATDLAASPNTETPKTLTVHIDSTSPVARILTNVKAKRGKTAKIKYRVTDTPGNGTASVVVKIKARSGKTVKTLRSGAARVDRSGSLKFRCKLKKGVYRVTVTAKDKAGNVSSVSAAKKLRVK